MMLAHRREGNIADNDHFLVIGLVELLQKMACGIFVHAREHLGASARDTRGRFEKPLAVRIFANGDEELADCGLCTGLVDVVVFEIRHVSPPSD